MHPDVDWPNGMEGGRVHGHREVKDYWTRQWDLIDPTVEPLRVESNDDGRVVVDVHQAVRDLNGAVIADRVVQHCFLIENGLITRMDIGNP